MKTALGRLIVCAMVLLFICSAVVFRAQAELPSPGDIITFGRYEQDNNMQNGPEGIEWIVLEVREGKAFLVSRCGLDMIQYHTKNAEITWEECSIRQWLNNDFLNAAFTPEEQAKILLTEVDNSSSQSYWNTDGGKNTMDYIFLLSYAEANQYFGVTYGGEDNVKARVKPTAYALARGSGSHGLYRTEDNERAGWWFLRSRGYYLHSSSNVNCSGALDRVSFDRIGQAVRPALWLDLN